MMKASKLAFALCIAGQACFAQLNFYYSSGRILEDPETKQSINSPFLAYHLNEEMQWVAYDPNSEEGRFVSVSSTYTTAVACGYVKGALNFLGNRIVTPSDTYTGIAISVGSNQTVEWFYAHNTGIVPSKFHWVQKLRDGMTLLSGHEYDEKDQTAILLRINKEGIVAWSHRLKDQVGLEVRSTNKDRIFWMTEHAKESKISIYELDQFTGNVLNEIILPGETFSEGIRASKTMFLNEESLLVARIAKNSKSKILISEHSLNGNAIGSYELDYSLDYNARLELQGITRRPNGNMQLVFNLNGAIAIEDRDPFRTVKGDEILLLTLDPYGVFLGIEKYGDEFTSVNGIYHINDKVAIAGTYEGELTIQDQTLDKKDKANSYMVYIDEFDPIQDIKDLPIDPNVKIRELTLYPNPITNERFLSVENQFVKPEVPYEIRIYDNSASLQTSQSGRTRFETSRDELNIASFPSGLFHVFVIQDNAVTAKGKFVITR